MNPFRALKAPLAVIIAFALCLFFAERCEGPHVDNVDTAVLAPEDQAKVVVQGDGKVVVLERQPDGTAKRSKGRYVPPEGRVSVAVKQGSGAVEVKIKARGLCFRPGLGAGWVGGRAQPVLDVKVAYLGRWGATLGTGLLKLSPYAAGTFQIYSNTALFAGSTLKKEYSLGIRLSF